MDRHPDTRAFGHPTWRQWSRMFAVATVVAAATTTPSQAQQNMCADCEALHRQLSTVLELHGIYEDAVEELHKARREVSVNSGIATAVGAAHIVLESFWIPASKAISLCGEGYKQAVLGIGMLRSTISGGTGGMALSAIVSKAGYGTALDVVSLVAFKAQYAKDLQTFRQLREDIDQRISEFQSALDEMERAKTSIRATMIAGGCKVGFPTAGDAGPTMQSDRSPASTSKFDEAAKLLPPTSRERPEPRTRQDAPVATEQPARGERAPRSTRRGRSGSEAGDDDHAKERPERGAKERRETAEAIRKLADDQREAGDRVAKETEDGFQRAQDQTKQLRESSIDAIRDLFDVVDDLESGVSPIAVPRESSGDDTDSLGSPELDALD